MQVVVTRAREQSSQLSDKLRAAGFEPVELPLIELVPPLDWTAADNAIAQIETYDWILFTSANAVRFLATRLDKPVTTAKVCCIGSSTKQVAEQYGWTVDLVPAEYVAESVVEAFANNIPKKLFLPRAAVARDTVPEALKAIGTHVDVAEVYRNVIPADAAANAQAVFAQKPAWIAFTSSSTVKNLMQVIERDWLRNTKIASIGPVTTETARKHGLTVDAEASPHTMDALVESITRLVRGRQ
ncbi:hypothetical protein F183_A50380 [Bryobacterales bacterium F-183]|nr:hypothetical protein F183_A50380 [Bryobacterales bacterium F-183]